MGGMKQLDIQRHDLTRQVTPIAIRTGALRRCSVHEDVVLWGGGDTESERHAYALATQMYNRGEVDAERAKDVAEAVHTAIEGGAFDCWRCAKLDSE